MSDGILGNAIESFSFARQGTKGEASNIPEEHWDYRPHPNAKSVSELVRHIIDASLMLVGEAADPDGDFMRRPPPDHVAAHAGHLPEAMTRDQLLEALDSSLQTCEERIRTADEDHWSGNITRFDGGAWKRITYIFYAGTHEYYHCGQLATYARTLGLIPELTQRIHGDAAS